MKRAKMIMRKVLYPPKWVLISVPPTAFAILIFIFAADLTERIAAYFIYGFSAFSFIIWVIAASRLLKRIKSGVLNSKAIKKISSSKIGAALMMGSPLSGRLRP